MGTIGKNWEPIFLTVYEALHMKIYEPPHMNLASCDRREAPAARREAPAAPGSIRSAGQRSGIAEIS